MSENVNISRTIWTASSEFGTYRLCEQRRFRRACASAQSRQNLRCSLIQAVNQAEPSDRKPDPLAPLNGWACAVEICHDRMLEDTNSLDGAHMRLNKFENKHAVNKEVYLRTRTIAQSPVHKIQEFLNAPTNVDILKVCKPTLHGYNKSASNLARDILWPGVRA